MKLSLPPEDFNQIDKVWMFQVLQHPDLSESNLLYQWIILTLNKLLNSNKMTWSMKLLEIIWLKIISTCISCSAFINHSIASFSNLTQLFISKQKVLIRKSFCFFTSTYLSINLEGALDMAVFLNSFLKKDNIMSVIIDVVVWSRDCIEDLIDMTVQYDFVELLHKSIYVKIFIFLLTSPSF